MASRRTRASSTCRAPATPPSSRSPPPSPTPRAGGRSDATFAPTPALRGAISLVTQSGALGVAILDHAKSLGVGFAKFCSLGNKAQVSLNDLLSAWGDDPDTKLVLAYIENFGNPKNFVRIAREVTKRKPIIAMKAGRSEAGGRAAASPPGPLGGADRAAG